MGKAILTFLLVLLSGLNSIASQGLKPHPSDGVKPLAIPSLIPQKKIVKAKKVRVTESFRTLRIPGECKAKESKEYFAKASGVVDFALSDRKQVAQGELVVAIDKEETEANLKASRESLARAAGMHANNRALYQNKRLSRDVVEKSGKDYRNAKFNDSQMSKIAASNLIRAPFNGEIMLLAVKPGDTVLDGQFLVSMISGYKKTIKFKVPESYDLFSAPIRIYVVNDSGPPASVLGNGAESSAPRVTRYKLSEVNISRFPRRDKTGFDGTGNVTYQNTLQHNSFVKLEIEYNIKQTISAPPESIFSKDSQQFVYKIDNRMNKAKLVEVTTGETVDGYVSITSGDIQEGDSVVTEGIDRLSDGAYVEVM